MRHTTSSEPKRPSATKAADHEGGDSQPGEHAGTPRPSGVASTPGFDNGLTTPTHMPVAEPEARRQDTGRWWAGVGAGAIVSLPFAWLLSHAALLPFLLGIFFFALFGLVIGAVMHRVASPGRPYPRLQLVIGTTLVVALGWTGSIVVEGRDFPRRMAAEAGDTTRYLGNRTIGEFRTAVADDVRRFIRDRYPPGGALGYVRWVLTSGELKKGDIAHVNRTLVRGQRKLLWAVRVILSVALLAFGIGSQTLPLKLLVERTGRAIDNPREDT
jgi:hypothetical protein